MTATADGSATGATTGPKAGMWAELPRLLDRLIGAHEAWLETLRAHQSAIGAAYSAALEAAIGCERALAEAVAQLNEERRVLIGAPRSGGPTITELANTRPADEKAALLERVATLRKLVERVRREQAVIREASASVLSHMRGLMHQLSSRLSHSGTYGSGGRVSAGPVVVSGLDIRQ